MKKVLKWLASALYGLVMIEVVIMISPFAFYWYSLYAPTLQGLHRWRATAWMESFFLPHSVITTSSFLEFMRWRVGSWAFGLGLLAALICALQVYGTKLFKHKAATGWMYKYIRHPFYLSLAVAGFGLLTIWPRMIILVLYVGMLLLYYFLARFEEKQVEAMHPEYAEYRKRTGMFLPGNPGGKLFGLFFGWIPSRGLALAASSVVIVVLVLGGALALRRDTIAHTATDLLPQDRTLAIAIWPTPPDRNSTSCLRRVARRSSPRRIGERARRVLHGSPASERLRHGEYVCGRGHGSPDVQQSVRAPHHFLARVCGSIRRSSPHQPDHGQPAG